MDGCFISTSPLCESRGQCTFELAVALGDCCFFFYSSEKWFASEQELSSGSWPSFSPFAIGPLNPLWLVLDRSIRREDMNHIFSENFPRSSLASLAQSNFPPNSERSTSVKESHNHASKIAYFYASEHGRARMSQPEWEASGTISWEKTHFTTTAAGLVLCVSCAPRKVEIFIIENSVATTMWEEANMSAAFPCCPQLRV